MCQLKLKMFSGIVVTLFISISGVTSKTTDQNYEVDELIVHLTSFINEEWVNMNSSQVDVDRNSYLFSYILIDKYGTSGVITESQLNSFITDVRDNWHVSDLKDHSEGPDSHVSQDSCSTGFEESLKCLDNKVGIQIVRPKMGSSSVRGDHSPHGNCCTCTREEIRK